MATDPISSKTVLTERIKQIAVGFSISAFTALLTYAAMQWMIRGIAPSLPPAMISIYCLAVAGAIVTAQCCATLAVVLFGSAKEDALSSLLMSARGANLITPLLALPILLRSVGAGFLLLILASLSGMGGGPNSGDRVNETRLQGLQIFLAGVAAFALLTLFFTICGGQIGLCLYLRARELRRWPWLMLLALAPGFALILSVLACLGAEGAKRFLGFF